MSKRLRRATGRSARAPQFEYYLNARAVEEEKLQQDHLKFYAEFQDVENSSRKRIHIRNRKQILSNLDSGVSTNDFSTDVALDLTTNRPSKPTADLPAPVTKTPVMNETDGHLPMRFMRHTHHSQHELNEMQLSDCRPVISPQIKSVDVAPIVLGLFPFYMEVVLQQLTVGVEASCLKQVTVRLPLMKATDEWGLVWLASVPEVGFDVAPGLHVSRTLLERSITKAAERKIFARVTPYVSGSQVNDFVRKGFGVLAIPELPRHVFVGPYVSGFLLSRPSFASFVKLLSTNALQLTPISNRDPVWVDPESPIPSPDGLRIVEEEDGKELSDTASLEGQTTVVAKNSASALSPTGIQRNFETEDPRYMPCLQNLPISATDTPADNSFMASVQRDFEREDFIYMPFLEKLPVSAGETSSVDGSSFVIKENVEDEHLWNLPCLEKLPLPVIEMSIDNATSIRKNEEEENHIDKPVLIKRHISATGEPTINLPVADFRRCFEEQYVSNRLLLRKLIISLPAHSSDDSSDDDVQVIGDFSPIKLVIESNKENPHENTMQATPLLVGNKSLNYLLNSKENPLPGCSTKMDGRKIVGVFIGDNESSPENTKKNVTKEILQAKSVADAAVHADSHPDSK